jgi:hypothetical protein
MMEMKHTPTPYTVSVYQSGDIGTYQFDEIREELDFMRQSDTTVDVLNAKEEACRAYIQRACNAHEELVAACQAFLEWDKAENDARPFTEDNGAAFYRRATQCCMAFDLARAALKKAENVKEKHDE